MTIFSFYIRKRRAWIFSGLLAVVIAGLPFMAGAQGGDWDMQNRIKRLENEIQTLSRAVYRGEKPPAGVGGDFAGGADTEIRLQQIETEVRGLRGDLEEQSFEIRELKDQLERFTSDMELRMNDLEGSGASRSGSAAPVSGASRYTAKPLRDSNPPSVVGSGAGQTYQWSSSNANSGGAVGQLGSYTESGDGTSSSDLASATYENAFSMVKNHQYKGAQVEFESFLRDHPDHPLAGNAKYWLGETHYVRGNFETAARIFAEGYQQYPKGSKAADNLLKLGLSLDALGKKDDACVALRQLKKENPSGAAPVMRRADQEMSRIGC